MENIVKNEKELAIALKNKEDTIIVEGDLKSKVIRIKATGKVSWAIAIAAIAAAVALIIVSIPTGGMSTAGSMALAPVAASIIGGPATLSCIGIAVAAGGVSVLNDLRNYDLIEKNGKIILKK